MDILRFLKLPLLAAIATLAVATMAAPAGARADSGHGSHHGSSGHDMGAAMQGMTPAEHAAHGMTPEEHAAHSEHSASSGHDASHHEEAVAKDRPVELVLAGFAVLNALVLLAAVILRRRPAAIKRRETLDRVRRAAGAGEPEPTGEASS